MENNKKVKAFKYLIKEAVREVIREEIRDIMLEVMEEYKGQLLTESKRPRPTYESFLPKHSPEVRTTKPISSPNMARGNNLTPIQKAIMQTAQNFSPTDRANLGVGAMENNTISMTSDMIGPMNPMGNMDLGEMEDYTPSSMPDFPQR